MFSLNKSILGFCINSLKRVNLLKNASCKSFPASSVMTGLHRFNGSSSNSQTVNNEETEIENFNLDRKFINRNPRNLELLGIAWKRKGWRFQYPSKEFYHRIEFIVTNRNMEANVVHSCGTKVVSCSTKELAIRKHLYNCSDVSSAINIGRVLAQRCLQFGIANATLLEWINADSSEKFQAFRKSLLDEGLQLTEPEEVEAPYAPGIDYDDQEKLAELSERQLKVWSLGKKSLLMKFLNKKRKLRGRNRPLFAPRPLIMPSYTYN
ncbi:hypothetical protein HELRODRAFT_112163 [Helobdella robusta]|uniref:Large ribosomal subunit protein uL18m n=1 Tax=Helobdella robusta TaxID=6412 RepID=T1EFH5_HELRO|nr:hypothetical protein HELRODRAFT_112163 [Helobdella robusta]ESO03790.1 hypothetical protein HELRODRAFT_112163 [Helobdella robusta]